MFDETSIAHKESQGVFTKTSSPLVASFKVGASLFLIFLFDFLDFFCDSIIDPFKNHEGIYNRITKKIQKFKQEYQK